MLKVTSLSITALMWAVKLIQNIESTNRLLLLVSLRDCIKINIVANNFFFRSCISSCCYCHQSSLSAVPSPFTSNATLWMGMYTYLHSWALLQQSNSKVDHVNTGCSLSIHLQFYISRPRHVQIQLQHYCIWNVEYGKGYAKNNKDWSKSTG